MSLTNTNNDLWKMNYVSSKLTAAKRLSRYVIVVWFLTNNPLIFRRGCQLQCGGGEHSSDHNSNNIHGWVSHTSENNWEMLEFHFSSFYPEHFQSKHAGTISYSYCFFSFLMYALLFLFSIFDASFLISFSSACSFLRPMSDIPFVTVGQSSELQQVRNPK